ncbi:hypothetical protein AN396_00890 [Candidatus Epulonipiscium fishelsonii]|uniref:Uncharacterized protein n=1 Tax=Candidatus Epulonipiscium fishelsonii TaxID=77094 RepID=A0ACC8XDI7_9FIRM|nr:hypothetical protein AN396_00890 [Epulopiscium sp. SCG-B11WGA-EpuloA1]
MKGVQKVWIVGATGKVGKEIQKLLDVREVELLETDTEEIDITEISDVLRYVHLNRPNVIINCADEKDETDVENLYKVNAMAAKNISIAARNIEARLIHISSCEVFGRDQVSSLDNFGTTEENSYNEFDVPRPSTLYGKTKLIGEERVKEFNYKYIIIRSGWVYGGKNNFVQQIINDCKANKPIEVFGNHYGSPTSPQALAKLIVYLITSQDYGTYHAACEGSCSKYEMALEIAKLLNSKSKITMKQDNVDDYKILNNFILNLSKYYEMPSWQKALKEYIKN